MLNQQAAAELKQIIDKQPRYPISLLPTPLVELPNFSCALGGPRIWIKRDDLTGLAYGGNKARILDFYIGDALAQGCDVFLGGGGAIQSNHALMCAAAARKAGLLPVIFARAGTKYYELQGDFLLTKILTGNTVHLYSMPGLAGEPEKPDLRSNAGKAAVATVMQQIADELRAQGHKPYILAGSGQPVGVFGYLDCALELALQCAERNLEPDWIFLTSSGVGQAGLLLGAKFLQQSYRIAGCAPDPDRSNEARSADVADLANRAAQLFDIGIQIEPKEVINLNYGGEAYGIITQAGMQAMQLLAQTEGIFLDPVYNAKGMSGLIDQIKQGIVGADDTVIYIHTGGAPLNFAYSRELAQAFNLSLEGDRVISG